MTQQNRKTNVSKEIDANLKRAFEDLSNEAVPDRFTALLDQLKKAETGGKGGATNDN